MINNLCQSIPFYRNPISTNILALSPVISEKNEKSSAMRQNALLPYMTAPISFGYYFAFKEQENLPCPCCGETMTTNEEILQFEDQMSKATGNDIVVGLEKYKDRLPETEKNVAIRLITAAQDYPDLQLDMLLKNILSEPKYLLEKRQKAILKEIRDLSELLSGSDDSTGSTYKIIKKDIEAINSIIIEGKNGSPFKRKTLIKHMEGLRDIEPDPENMEILKLIVEKSEEMPTSGTDANAFIVKYSRRTAGQIAKRILEPSQSTAEHIRPHSPKDGRSKGVDGPANYLAECKKCNNDRGNMTYVEWLKIHPEMINNSQKYMDEVINRIIKGQIKGFDFYPKAVKRAIFDESGGQIRLDISKMDDLYKNQLKPISQRNVRFPSGVILNAFA